MIAEPDIEVDRETRRQFRSLARNKDYQGAFDLVNSKYNLDAGIEGKYTMSYVDSDVFSGTTGGDAFQTKHSAI